MGILSDIGRSNAVRDGQSVFNDVLKYKQAERQDDRDAMAGIAQAQTMETQRQQLAIAQAHEQRVKTEFDQKQTELNQFLPATYFFGSEDKWSPAQRKMYDDLKASNLLEDRAGVFGATRRNFPVIKEYMNRNPEQVVNWGALDIIQRSQEIGVIKDKIRAEPDPEKAKALQADLDAKTATLSGLTDQHKSLIDILPKVAEAKAIAAARSTYKVVQSDESPTGWAYQHPETGDLIEGAPPPRDYGADTLYRSATLEERIRHNRVVGSKAAAGMGGKLDLEGARGLIRTLPKLKEEAVSASGNLQRIDEMTGLLDKGFGGKAGQIKAWLAPWAEAAGLDVKGLSEAQTYELLAQTLGGSMRMAIVGPGQVSNFEQQMLNRVNAGGRAATPAARELLKYYRDIAARKVNDYNDSVDGVAEVSPATAKLYKKITGGGVAAPAAGGSVTTAEEFLRKKGWK